MSGKRILLGAAIAATMIITPISAGQAAAAPSAPASPQSVTVFYDASGAPSFRAAIAAGVAHWNASVSNVKLQENPGAASFSYYEGNDPNGSYAYTDGHGSGYVFIDYSQAGVYDNTRIAAHETGHVLGLPDHYQGPCSELMSGGGPGPSCTNSYPNATESAQVNNLWAFGLLSNAGPMKRIDEKIPTAAH